MTSATAGKPTVAPLTTPEGECLAPADIHQHLRSPGSRPTTNKEQCRLASDVSNIGSRRSVKNALGMSGVSGVMNGLEILLTIFHQHFMNLRGNTKAANRELFAIDPSPVYLV